MSYFIHIVSPATDILIVYRGNRILRSEGTFVEIRNRDQKVDLGNELIEPHFVM